MLPILLSTIFTTYLSHLYHTQNLHHVEEKLTQEALTSSLEDADDYAQLSSKQFDCFNGLRWQTVFMMPRFANDFNTVTQKAYPEFPFEMIVLYEGQSLSYGTLVHNFSSWAVPEGLQVQLIAI